MRAPPSAPVLTLRAEMALGDGLAAAFDDPLERRRMERGGELEADRFITSAAAMVAPGARRRAARLTIRRSAERPSLTGRIANCPQLTRASPKDEVAYAPGLAKQGLSASGSPS